MPEYQAPTVADTGDTFPATYPIELAGSAVFVNFEVQTYEPPANTNVDFDVGGSFEEASVEFVFNASITEEAQAFESLNVDLALSPEITNTELVPVILENLTQFDYGEPFPATFPIGLGPSAPAGLVFEPSIREFSDIETLYGESLAKADKQQIVTTIAEQSIITLGQGEREEIELGNAEVD